MSKETLYGTMMVNRVHYSTNFGKKTEVENESDEQQIECQIFGDVVPGEVSIGLRTTKNLGNFESMQLSADIRLPCIPTDEGVSDAYTAAQSLLSSLIEDMQEIYTPTKGTDQKVTK